jgi:hypothetical protein
MFRFLVLGNIKQCRLEMIIQVFTTNFLCLLQIQIKRHRRHMALQQKICYIILNMYNIKILKYA